MRSTVMSQFYCDWCYDELIDRSMALSQQLGLCDRGCCVCDSCFERAAYVRPPDLWQGPTSGWSWTTSRPTGNHVNDLVVALPATSRRLGILPSG